MTALLALVAAAFLMTAAAPAPARAAATHTPVLAQGAGMGSKPSAAVRRVQRVLQSRGYSLGGPGVDGRFGPLTAAAVRQLQADSGLAADGIVGPRTRRVVRRIERRAQRRSSMHPTSTRISKPAPKATATTPQSPTTVGNDNGSEAGWLAVLAVAVVAAGLAVARRRTGQRPAETDPRPLAAQAIVPLAHELYLEGRSTDEAIGRFRGEALAATTAAGPGEDPGQGRTWYLVDDVRKPAPVWVREDAVRRLPSGLKPGEPVIGYVTVSAKADRTEADGAVHEIEEACERGAWELAEVVTDRESGRGLERPGLAYALEQIADGNARGLVVSDLRRLSRSIVDLGRLMEWFREAGAGLVALDLGVDTSTPGGRDVAATLITLGDWESERIARRTRSGLAEVRASGRPTGRPAVGDRPDLVDRITAMREANMTLQAIADQLNAEGVPTLRGGVMWRPSSVQASLGYRRPGTRGSRDQFPTLEDRA
jgi:DNA invertase Pin-like site-specific DNA recombinase